VAVLGDALAAIMGRLLEDPERKLLAELWGWPCPRPLGASAAIPSLPPRALYWLGASPGGWVRGHRRRSGALLGHPEAAMRRNTRRPGRPSARIELVRNSGWYIPFWRKPKRAGGDAQSAEKPERRRKPRTRSDEELERVRSDWVTRYTRQVHALQVLGLSVGVPREEIQQRYRLLLAELEHAAPDDEQRRRLEDAYHTLNVES
jgi:hypothetical protein